MRLTRRNVLKGEPFQNVASLEPVAVLVALMVFGDNPQWRAGRVGGVQRLRAEEVRVQQISAQHSGDGVGLAARQVGVGNGAAMASMEADGLMSERFV